MKFINTLLSIGLISLIITPSMYSSKEKEDPKKGAGIAQHASHAAEPLEAPDDDAWLLPKGAKEAIAVPARLAQLSNVINERSHKTSQDDPFNVNFDEATVHLFLRIANIIVDIEQAHADEAQRERALNLLHNYILLKENPDKIFNVYKLAHLLDMPQITELLAQQIPFMCMHNKGCFTQLTQKTKNPLFDIPEEHEFKESLIKGNAWLFKLFSSPVLVGQAIPVTSIDQAHNKIDELMKSMSSQTQLSAESSKAVATHSQTDVKTPAESAGTAAAKAQPADKKPFDDKLLYQGIEEVIIDHPNSVAFSPDYTMRVVAERGPEPLEYGVTLYRLVNSSWQKTGFFKSLGRGSFNAVAWSPDGNLVVAGGKENFTFWKLQPDGTLKTGDVSGTDRKGNFIKKDFNEFDHMRLGVDCNCLAWSPDMQTLAIGNGSGRGDVVLVQKTPEPLLHQTTFIVEFGRMIETIDWTPNNDMLFITAWSTKTTLTPRGMKLTTGKLFTYALLNKRLDTLSINQLLLLIGLEQLNQSAKGKAIIHSNQKFIIEALNNYPAAFKAVIMQRYGLEK